MDFMTLASDPMFWIYAGIFMLIGIIIGWLFTRRGWRKRLNESEERISNMQAAQRREQREQEQQGDSSDQVSQLTAQVEELQASLKATEDELDVMRVEADEAVIVDEPTPEVEEQEPDTTAEVDESEPDESAPQDSELSDLRMQLSLLQDEFDAATQKAASELEQTRTEAEMAIAARVALEAELAAAREEAGSARQDAGAMRAQIDEVGAGSQNKEIALNEAYEHAAAVQSQLKACEDEVATARNDVQEMQGKVSALEAAKDELELRIKQSRSDVAGDLAVLTSTMLKIKDDALEEANARIAQLSEEVDRLSALAE